MYNINAVNLLLFYYLFLSPIICLKLIPLLKLLWITYSKDKLIKSTKITTYWVFANLNDLMQNESVNKSMCRSCSVNSSDFYPRVSHILHFEATLCRCVWGVRRAAFLIFLPWVQRTSERVHRTAERGRAAAGRRASCPSVAARSPNYARSKLQSVPTWRYRKLKIFVWQKQKRCLESTAVLAKSCQNWREVCWLNTPVSKVLSGKQFV